MTICSELLVLECLVLEDSLEVFTVFTDCSVSSVLAVSPTLLL